MCSSDLRKGNLDKIETMQLMANIAKKGLSTLEYAEGLLRFEEAGLNRSEIGVRAGINRKYVSKYIIIASWPEEVKDLIRNNDSKIGRAKLFSLAKKDTKPEEVLSQLKVLLKKSPKSTKIPNKQFELCNKVNAFFDQRKVSKKEREIFVEGLEHLGLVSKTAFENHVNQSD